MYMGLVTTVSLAQSLPAGLPAPSQLPQVSVSGGINTTSSSTGANGSSTHYASASSYQSGGPFLQSNYTVPGYQYQQAGASVYVGGISGATASNVSGVVTGAGTGGAVAHSMQSGSVVGGAIQPLGVFYDSAGNPVSQERIVGESTAIVSVRVDGESAATVVGNGSAGVQGSAFGDGYSYTYTYGSPEPYVNGEAYINYGSDITNVAVTGNGSVDGSYSTVDVQSYYNAQYEGSPGATDHLKSLP